MWRLIFPALLLIIVAGLSFQTVSSFEDGAPEETTGTAQLGDAPTPRSYESYYLYLGNYPQDRNMGWHQDVQGVTHDDNHWFITQTRALWKIPVSRSLNDSVSPNTPGVQRVVIGDFKDLKDYNHFGDLTYYEFGGQGYLCVPLEDMSGQKGPALGIFRADTLQYVDHEQVSSFGQKDAPWCAIDPEGFLYSSNFDGVSTINKYRVEWQTLRDTGDLRLSIAAQLTMLNELGGSISLNGMQGGVFPPSGQLLYVVANGIHVFDASTGKKVQSSTEGKGYFRYEFDDSDRVSEEPEGLTIWDLDDGRAPNIKGQLHVLMLDNDCCGIFGGGDDDIYFKHYTGTIYVDGAYNKGRNGLSGTPTNPFSFINQANDLAWDGAQIKIKAGVYPIVQPLTFSKRLKVVPDGGAVIITPIPIPRFPP